MGPSPRALAGVLRPDTIVAPAEVRLLTETTGAPQLWLLGSYAVRGGLLTKIVFELASTSPVWTGVSAYQYRARSLFDSDRYKTGLIYARP